MIEVDRNLAARLVGRARLAPSAHNVQPTRVALRDGALLLLADPQRRLPVSDPRDHDMLLSHGAFVEGLALALSEEGLRIGGIETFADPCAGEPLARIVVDAGGEVDPLAAHAATRTTWRGAFAPADEAARQRMLAPLAAHPDLVLVTDRAKIARIAALADEANLHFMRHSGHRRELLDWLRLSTGHPDHARDGLNAEAMGFGRIVAAGAGLTLGPLFGLLDALGLAGMLTAEAAVTRSAAAIAVFHRPEGEAALDRGRALYRAWLEMERAGIAGRPISVLTDWDRANEEMRGIAPVPPGRQAVKVFRIGRPAGERRIVHARLPVEELLLAS